MYPISVTWPISLYKAVVFTEIQFREEPFHPMKDQNIQTFKTTIQSTENQDLEKYPKKQCPIPLKNDHA